jgi:tetratricopeptide (TPR) repeat protein
MNRALYDPAQAHKTIVFYERRIRRDPQSALDLAFLSGAYLQHSRETGDIADAVRAEQAARRSLAVRSYNNVAAANRLTISLLTQHRFSDAQRAADRALAQYPDDLQAKRLRVEILIERGDYQAAEKSLNRLVRESDHVSVLALHARMLEINGEPERSLAIFQRIQSRIERIPDMNPVDVAWYAGKEGDLLAGMGRSEEAERAYRRALEAFPRDFKTLTSLARLAAERGDWLQAIQWGEHSAAIVPAPETLALIAEARMARGETVKAQQQYRLIEAIAKLSRAQGTVYNRQRAQYLADRNIHLDEALMLARRELKERRDIVSWDTLAWVCCRKAMQTKETKRRRALLSEAQAAIRIALSRHTRSARIRRHADLIAQINNDRVSAR